MKGSRNATSAKSTTPVIGLRVAAVLAIMGLLASACSAGEDSAADPQAATDRLAPAEPHAPADEAQDFGDIDGDAHFDAEQPVDAQPPQVPHDVTFADYGVAGFVSTADLPLSTFQTDADVASFRLAHAWLERRGLLPPGEAIRAEEWVNAIDHRYPDPDPGGTFRIVSDAGAPWWHSAADAPRETVLLRVGVQAAREVTRQPASITLVIDTSGSMSTDNRLDTVIQVASDLTDRLGHRDQVGIVEFNTRAHLVMEHTNDFQAVRNALAGLRPGGSTNTGDGVILGHELAASAHRPGDNSTVVLFADGVANQGITDAEEILASLDDRGERIVMHTVGIGIEVYNDALLERLANDRSGTYAYIDLAEQAGQLFDRDLPVLAPVAHDVKAQVEFNPAVVGAWRLVGYENRLIAPEDFRDDTVPGGYVGAGHTVTALYELELEREFGVPDDQLGTVTVRWVVPDSGETGETATDLPVDLLDRESASTTFGTAAAMGALAETLRGSPHVVVSLDQVADRLEGTGDDQDRWLAGIVRAAAGVVQVSTPERQEVAPPGITIEDHID